MFTPGLEQVLRTIHPGARPAGRVTFPLSLSEGGARRSASEPANAWLRRSVEEGFDGQMGRVAVEDNLALFLVIRWSGRAIEYANLQALWADAPLSRFVTGAAEHDHRYLRLDYDMTALGPLLKEPLPHVHVEGEGEPRFPLPSSAADDVVGWFLDFVYRNFFYDHWIVWAEVAWDDWCRERSRPNRWPRLVQAFNQSAVRLIEADEALKQDLREMKRCIREGRLKLFPLLASRSTGELFSHEP
jgi:hypothetical protein